MRPLFDTVIVVGPEKYEDEDDCETRPEMLRSAARFSPGKAHGF